MQTTIRTARPEDASRLSQLARAKARWGYPDLWLEIWQEDLTITPGYLQAHHGFVAQQEDVLLGVCVLEDHKDHWALEHVWVDPGAQRQGVGQTLVRHALAWVGAQHPAPVKVVADPNAMPFYERFGARQTGEKPAPMPGAPERVLPVLELRAG